MRARFAMYAAMTESRRRGTAARAVELHLLRALLIGLGTEELPGLAAVDGEALRADVRAALGA